MKKLIIFDLDGTLLDTLEDLKQSVNFALSKYGFPLRSKEQVRKDIGNGVAKLVERSIPNNAANPLYFECLGVFKEHYHTHYFENTFPYKDMPEVIKILKEKEYLLAVATNKIDQLAKNLIDMHYKDLFDFVLGDIDGVPKKPYPNMINNILKHFNVSKEEALYIGDTNVDEQTAINSGLDYFLLTYGYRTKEEILTTCKCRDLVDTPKDILKRL